MIKRDPFKDQDARAYIVDLIIDRDRAIEERDAAKRWFDAAIDQRDEALRKCQTSPLGVVEEALRAQVESLSKQRSEWCNRHDEVRARLQEAMARTASAEAERDALGLQLAALRADNERMAKALNDIKAMHRVTIVDDGVLLDDAIAIACAALTHGVDVTEKKSGE